MAGTRTAPAFTAAATRRVITLHLIDASGDTYPESFDVAIAATAASIEAWAAAYAAASQASLYEITEELFRTGDADPDNAETDQRNSSRQGINILFKIPATGVSTSERLVSPIPAVMQGNQDIPLATSTELAAVITTSLVLLPSYAAQSVRYTERREKGNALIKL